MFLRPTQNGGIAKPARKGPQTQTNKGNQRAASNMVPGIQAPKRTGSMNEPLKITISNDRSQRPVLVSLHVQNAIALLCIQPALHSQILEPMLAKVHGISADSTYKDKDMAEALTSRLLISSDELFSKVFILVNYKYYHIFAADLCKISVNVWLCRCVDCNDSLSVQPRPQARPVIPNPQQQFSAPGQGQAGRVRSTVQAANGYTPAVRQAEYAVAAQPVRQTYQDNVSCTVC